MGSAPESVEGETVEHQLGSSFAPSSQGAFVEAYFRRVREVDDGVMAHLMQLLLRLRRTKHTLVVGGLVVVGGLAFGTLPVSDPLYAVMICSTLALMVGMPTFATGSLAVRRIFLKEAQRLSLSRSTAMLLLTRAERRARFMRPFWKPEERIEMLISAVRSWDTAD